MSLAPLCKYVGNQTRKHAHAHTCTASNTAAVCVPHHTMPACGYGSLVLASAGSAPRASPATPTQSCGQQSTMTQFCALWQQSAKPVHACVRSAQARYALMCVQHCCALASCRYIAPKVAGNGAELSNLFSKVRAAVPRYCASNCSVHLASFAGRALACAAPPQHGCVCQRLLCSQPVGVGFQLRLFKHFVPGVGRGVAWRHPACTHIPGTRTYSAVHHNAAYTPLAPSVKASRQVACRSERIPFAPSLAHAPCQTDRDRNYARHLRGHGSVPQLRPVLHH